MPKIRKPKALIDENDFINSADNVNISIEEIDQNAKRDYKKINVPFNQYEYSILEKAAKETGRTKLNFIRWAILETAQK